MNNVLVLKKRKEFLRVAKQGVKFVSSCLILQAAQNLSDNPQTYIGYTATKKIGKAHLRNRTKRRLRAAVRTMPAELYLPQTSYVLVGRYNTSTVDFQKLKEELQKALTHINKTLCKEKKNEQNSLSSSDSAD